MYVNKWEMLSAMLIFGVLWAVLPWEPLSTFEGMLAAFYLMIISFGSMAVIQKGILVGIEKFKEVKTRWFASN